MDGLFSIRAGIVRVAAWRRRRPTLFGLIAALIGGFVIATYIDITPAQAEQSGFNNGKLSPDMLTPADKDKPKGKQKLREPKCKDKECLDLYQQLKDALESYYIQQYNTAQEKIDNTTDSSSITQAMSSQKFQALSGLESIGSIKSNTDSDGIDAAKKKDAKRKTDPKFPKPDKLAEAINKLVADLIKCEEKCKPKEEPKKPDKPITEQPVKPIKEQPVKPVKEQPVKPKRCFKTEGERDKAAEKAQEKVEAAQNELNKIALDSDGHLTLPGTDDPKYPAYKEAAEKLEKAKDELREINGADVPCPNDKGGGSMYFPGTPLQPGGQSYAVSIPGQTHGTAYVSTDSTTYCTFGDATSTEVIYVPADNNGDAITSISSGGSTVTPGTSVTPGGRTTPGDMPKTPSTPPMTDKTPTPGTPPVTDKNPTPDMPPTTDNTPTPSTTTTDNTPTPITTNTDNTPTPPVHVTIYIKASQAVLEGGQTGDPIQGQIVMLVLRNKPAVPSTAEEKTANDKDSNMPAPKGVTGANGEGRFDVPIEQLPLYMTNQQPTIAGKPVNNFRVEFNLMKHNGVVVETTGRTLPDLKSSAIAAYVLEPFAFGGHAYLRIGVNTPYRTKDDLVEKIRKLFGVPVEIDICIIKEPGPPLGNEPASYGALNHELPQTSIKLRKSTRVMAGVP
jgi:hypothetical protein